MSGSSNIAGGGASVGVMEPSRHELLLMRVLDGEATAGERAELLAWADAEPRLAAWEVLRAELRAALQHDGPVEVAADVLAALDEESWSPLGAELRAALTLDGSFLGAEGGKPPSATPPPVPAFDLARVVVAAPGAAPPSADASSPRAPLEAADAANRGGVPFATPPPVPGLDLASAVLAALPGDVLPLSGAPEGWDATVAELQAALAPAHEAPNLSDDVLTALGNLDAPAGWDHTAEALRAALTDAASVAAFDVWPAVAADLDTRPNVAAPEGWPETAVTLQAALAPEGSIDVAPAVMEAVGGRGALRVVNGGGGSASEAPVGHTHTVSRRPFFAVTGGMALAAAALLALRLGETAEAPAPGVATISPPSAVPAALDLTARPLAARNDATVEDLTTAGTVTAQVMQFEEGGPTIIFVNEVES